MAIDDDKALDRLQQVLTWGPFLDNLVSAAKELGQRRLEQGLEVPGYKLVLGKANRKWVSEAEVVTKLSEAGFTMEEMLEPPKEPALKSPAQMEKLGEPRSKERKKAKELVEVLAIKPPGKVAMAPLSDPREAVAVGTAADDFEGVD